MVQLRHARQEDLDALRDVYRRSSLSNDGDREVLLAHPDALHFAGDGISEGRTIVAVDDGRIVGFATLGTVVDAAVELEDLFVDPAVMRRGIGRALVRDVVRCARAVGASRIDVVANADARPFYESVGFVECGTATTRFGPAATMTLDIRDTSADPS